MRELTFLRAGELEWQERKDPRLETGIDAIVRPLAVTRCDLDLYIARGDNPLTGPFGFGHEIAGEIVDVGDQVKTFAPGDRVIVPFQISCGNCDMCRRGFTNSCTAVPAYSAYGLAPSSGRDWGGGLADFVHVPYADAMLVHVPAAMSLTAAAALSDNAVDGYRTVAHHIQKTPGAPVLVVGGLAQSVGLYAVQSAIALGASSVTYTDNDAARIATAQTLGAETLFLNYTDHPKAADQYPIVVDASATAGGLNFALRSTAPCGHCTGVSSPFDAEVDLPLRAMYMKGATYDLSRVHARGQIEDALDCAACGRFDTGAIIQRSLPFSEAAEAMMDADLKLVFLQET